MKMIIEMLRGFTSLSLAVYIVMVVSGFVKGDLMTFQWVMLLAIIFMWIMVRVIRSPEGDEVNVEQNT